MTDGDLQPDPQVPAKRRRGAPKGNQNARKHGFYSRVLTDKQRVDLALADDVKGIESEISLLRMKLASIMERDPDNTNLILKVTVTLARLVRTNDRLTNQNKQEQLRDGLENVFREFALPLGLFRETGKMSNGKPEIRLVSEKFGLPPKQI